MPDGGSLMRNPEMGKPSCTQHVVCACAAQSSPFQSRECIASPFSHSLTAKLRSVHAKHSRSSDCCTEYSTTWDLLSGKPNVQ